MTTEDGTFTRLFELESRNIVLTLYQKEIGDVSCVVWDAALVLAKYLDTSCQDNKFGRNWLQRKKVIELGAGVGCVGMTAACLGADVLMTDLTSTLSILEKNIEINKKHWESSGSSVKVQTLDWSKDIQLDFKPDIVMLADCVYYIESVKPLLDTLGNLSENKKDMYILLCQEERDTPGQLPVWQEFLKELKQRFKINHIPLSEQHPVYSSQDIHLMKLIKI